MKGHEQSMCVKYRQAMNQVVIAAEFPDVVERDGVVSQVGVAERCALWSTGGSGGLEQHGDVVVSALNDRCAVSLVGVVGLVGFLGLVSRVSLVGVVGLVGFLGLVSRV
ncbi:MAG: hypothetical protein F4098_14245, partial [Acidimicrobiaceae bacterium]|nr:hypothetical protein [Acidimicrobiaceae bacterium]